MQSFSLDAPVGVHFNFRDFIECGKTWERSAKEDSTFDNRPVQNESWLAIGQLGAVVLDTIWTQFGALSLTHGFTSGHLSRLISKSPNPEIAPSNDQHAACELNTKGNLICRYLGAACDFRVQGKVHGMHDVARWIVDHVQFDSLYYYGDDRAVHVSWGPLQRRNVVLMNTHNLTGKRSPGLHARGDKGTAILNAAAY